jgi:hypothetical protein
MKLNEIVPWGRSLAEYQLMFSLSDDDLQRKILGCGDGPASFNAEMTAQGKSVVSFDPVYQFSVAEIRQRVADTYETIISQVQENRDRYVWHDFSGVEALGKARLLAMEKFLADYEINQQRYLCQALPHLDFADAEFELCLCSHLLFLYAEQLSLAFHIAAIKELLRVATEVRIFPLLQLNCESCPYLDPIIQLFSDQGYDVQVITVAYEFQKGGNQMLRITNV